MTEQEIKQAIEDFRTLQSGLYNRFKTTNESTLNIEIDDKFMKDISISAMALETAQKILGLLGKLENEIRELPTHGTDDEDYVLVRRFDVFETIKEVLEL